MPLATVRTRLPPPRRRRPCPAPARAARRRCSRREAPGPRAPRPGRPEALGAGSQLNSGEPRSTSFVTGAAFSCHTERRQGHPANTWQADWEPHAWGRGPPGSGRGRSQGPGGDNSASGACSGLAAAPGLSLHHRRLRHEAPGSQRLLLTQGERDHTLQVTDGSGASPPHVASEDVDDSSRSVYE